MAGQDTGAGGTARVVEGVGAQAQFGVPGQESEVVAVERESGPERLLRAVVVVVLVLGGVPQRQPALQVGVRAVLVQALLRGAPHGSVAARPEQLLAALLVRVDRRHAGFPPACHPREVDLCVRDLRSSTAI
ncbi:hypothetical protein [Streptomyces nigra]|uniref:hypothetical protein n=1 Tax=Streptomyces nigra TaxID=1827580 RepID=UPI00341CFC68